MLSTNTAVRVPADMKGMKIRVPGMKAILAFFQEVGANPTPMPLTELFTALKTGVVVGQDNGIDQVEASGFSSTLARWSGVSRMTLPRNRS